MSEAQFPFDGLRPPSLPKELRERVLGAAREATLVETPALVDRIWESRRARLAAATVFAILLAFSFFVRPLTGPPTQRPTRGVGTSAPEVEGFPLPDHREDAAEQLRDLRWELLVDGREQAEQ